MPAGMPCKNRESKRRPSGDQLFLTNKADMFSAVPMVRRFIFGRL